MFVFIYILFLEGSERGEGKKERREMGGEFVVHKEKSHCKFKCFLEKFIEP